MSEATTTDPLTWPGSLNPEKLSPEKRLEIEGIRQAEAAIAGGFIRLGGHLCRLKELCEHGEFEALAAFHFRLGARHRQRAMQVYLEFGEEKRLTSRFSANALIELTRADDPQAALAEANERADAGEEVTGRVAREIADAQKRAEAAEKKAEAVQLKLDDAMTAIDELRDKLEVAQEKTLSAATPRGRDLMASGKIRRMIEELRDIIDQVGDGLDRQHTDEAMLKLARFAAEYFGLDADHDPYSGLPENLVKYLKRREAA